MLNDNKMDYIEKLNDENTFHFLYGFRNYLSPTKLMENLMMLNNQQNYELQKK